MKPSSMHAKTLLPHASVMHAVNVTRFVDFVGKASVLFDRTS